MAPVPPTEGPVTKRNRGGPHRRTGCDRGGSGRSLGAWYVTRSRQNEQRVDVEHRHVDPTAPSRLRYPTPALCHRNYPMYTPGGLDRRWVNEFELKRSDVKWVGNMMYDVLCELAEGWR